MCTLQVVSGRVWLAALVLVSAGPNLLSEGEGRSGLQVLLSPHTQPPFACTSCQWDTGDKPAAVRILVTSSAEEVEKREGVVRM